MNERGCNDKFYHCIRYGNPMFYLYGPGQGHDPIPLKAMVKLGEAKGGSYFCLGCDLRLSISNLEGYYENEYSINSTEAVPDLSKL